MIPLIALAYSILVTTPTSSVQIFPSTGVVQGQVLEITFDLQDTKDSTSISANFLNTQTPCYPKAALKNAQKTPQKWMCLISVPASAPTGDQLLQILANQETIAQDTIPILAFQFPIEPLDLSDEKKALLKQEDSQKSVKKIKEALHTENQSQLWQDPFIYPIHGPIESSYGEHRVVDGEIRPGYHRGVDIGVLEGSAVRCTNVGRVLLTGMFTEEGNMVIVDHGQGIVSVYMHLSQIFVHNGQQVKKGETLGLSGSTGVANTPHLHFGIYIHATPTDPINWLETFIPGYFRR